jgi:hypothetical protein
MSFSPSPGGCYLDPYREHSIDRIAGFSVNPATLAPGSASQDAFHEDL